MSNIVQVDWHPKSIDGLPIKRPFKILYITVGYQEFVNVFPQYFDNRDILYSLIQGIGNSAEIRINPVLDNIEMKDLANIWAAGYAKLVGAELIELEEDEVLQ